MKTYTAYRVTQSDMEQIPVGKILVDTGTARIRDWNFMLDDGLHPVVGESIGRLCPTCVSKHDRSAALGHHGDCGPDAPRFTPSDEVSRNDDE